MAIDCILIERNWPDICLSSWFVDLSACQSKHVNGNPLASGSFCQKQMDHKQTRRIQKGATKKNWLIKMFHKLLTIINHHSPSFTIGLDHLLTSPISMEKQKLQHVGQSHSLPTLRTLRPREPQRFPLRGLFGLRRAAGPSGARPGASARLTTIEYHRIYPQCLYKYYLYMIIYIYRVCVCNYSYSTHWKVMSNLPKISRAPKISQATKKRSRSLHLSPGSWRTACKTLRTSAVHGLWRWR